MPAKLYFLKISIILVLLLTLLLIISPKNEVFAKTIPLPEDDFVSTQALDIDYPIVNLQIDGKINIGGEDGFVRAILVDKSGNEYLAYEANSLLVDGNSFNIQNACEETCILPSITPDYLRIEGRNASFELTSITGNNDYDGKNLKDASIDLKAESNKVKQEKDKEKLEKIKKNISKKNLKWVAGETSISKMSYAQKRKLFNLNSINHLPNLHGLEYYVGGVFESAQSSEASSGQIVSDTYPRFWDYRDYHGENWLTSVKFQGNCGSCWVFSSLGSIEAAINLYYNQHLDLDLSEQDVLSCSGLGSCSGGPPAGALKYAKTIGIVDESCFPYTSLDTSCNKCSDWNSMITNISGYSVYDNSADNYENLIKEKVITNGPVIALIFSLNHAMSLVGWETDETDNSIIWIFKNSWGEYWGEDGFGRFKEPADWISVTYVVDIPGTKLYYLPNVPSVSCVDKDADNYCNWGIGKVKPDNCPVSCKPEKDCNDSDPNVLGLDSFYNCIGSLQTPIGEAQTLSGDINNDGTVNIQDFQLLSNSFGKSNSEVGYEIMADLNQDGIINIQDFQILSNNF